MAKKPVKDSSADASVVVARVLVDCALGPVDSVVEITPEQAAAHASDIDAHPDAVAYARGLQK